jgi:signal transduction histidine kinase
LKLRDEAQKAIDTINYVILETKATIINEIGENIWVNAIPTYLDSILLNLLTNAVKYRSTERSPVIRMYAERGEEGFILFVEDNGIGIDLVKNGEKLFGMYKTFHNNPDAKGFGLFITKNQVEAMNGRIEVESEVGKGSKFKVYF